MDVPEVKADFVARWYFESLRELKEESAMIPRDLEEYYSFLSDWLRDFDVTLFEKGGDAGAMKEELPSVSKREIGTNQHRKFNSNVLLAQVKLTEAQQMTRALPVPNVFMTSLCCDMLGRICSAFGSHAASLRQIHEEMVSFIFVQEPQALVDVHSTTTYYLLVRSLKNRLRQLQFERDDLIFKRKKLLEHTQRQKQMFKASLSHWHTGLLTNTFQAWKKYTELQRRQISKVQVLFSRFWKNEDQTRWYFHRWRTFRECQQREQLLDDFEKSNLTFASHESSLEKCQRILRKHNESLNDLKQEYEQIVERTDALEIKRQDLQNSIQRYAKEHDICFERSREWQTLGASVGVSMIRTVQAKIRSALANPNGFAIIQPSSAEELRDSVRDLSSFASKFLFDWAKFVLDGLYQNLERQSADSENLSNSHFSLCRQKLHTLTCLSELCSSGLLFDLSLGYSSMDRSEPSSNRDSGGGSNKKASSHRASKRRVSQRHIHFKTQKLLDKSIALRRNNAGFQSSNKYSEPGAQNTLDTSGDPQGTMDNCSSEQRMKQPGKLADAVEKPLAFLDELESGHMNHVLPFFGDLMGRLPLLPPSLDENSPIVKKTSDLRNQLAHVVGNCRQVPKIAPNIAVRVSEASSLLRNFHVGLGNVLETRATLDKAKAGGEIWQTCVQNVHDSIWKNLVHQVSLENEFKTYTNENDGSFKGSVDRYPSFNHQIALDVRKNAFQDALYNTLTTHCEISIPDEKHLLFDLFMDSRDTIEQIVKRYHYPFLDGGFEDFQKETNYPSDKKQLQQVITRMNIVKALENNDTSILPDPMLQGISITIEFLVRIAMLRLPDQSNETRTIYDQVNLLLRAIKGMGILQRTFLEVYQLESLKAIFEADCAGRKTRFMPFSKWILFLERHNLIDERLSKPLAKELFDSSVIKHENHGDDGEARMCFAEFCTGLGAVACIRYRDPFSPPSIKIDALLNIMNLG